MGLGIEGLELKSPETSDVMKNSSGKSTSFDETNHLNNGNSVTESLEVVNSPPLVMAETSTSPSPSLGKGTGLKKWKRIKRDPSIDGGSNVDNSKLLKRGLPNFATNLNNPKDFSSLVKQTSEVSVSSSNAVLQSFGDALVDNFGGILDSELVIRPILTDGTESDNSEDHDSDLEMWQKGPEMNRMKNLSGKNLGNSVINGHQGKPRTESSKKARGGPVKSEKENSYSSMESVFVQGSYSAATINGRRNGMPMIYGGETTEEEAECSRKIAESEVACDDTFPADTSSIAKDRDLDPLVESIMLLQSVQQELGKEVEKFKDIGNGDRITEDLCKQLESGELMEESFDNLKSDATTSLKGMVNSSNNKDDVGKVNLDRLIYRDMEVELESLYKQKIEVEIEYIAITTTVQFMRIAVADQIKIFEEKKKEQDRMHIKKLGDAECKAVTFKKQSKKLDFFCDNESLKLKSSVWKCASFLFLQLVLFAVFIWNLSPNQADFVPT